MIPTISRTAEKVAKSKKEKEPEGKRSHRRRRNEKRPEPEPDSEDFSDVSSVTLSSSPPSRRHGHRRRDQVSVRQITVIVGNGKIFIQSPTVTVTH